MVLKIASDVNINYIIAAYLFGIINLVLFGYVMYIIYRKLGASVTLIETLEIVFISRLGVYIPGKIWYATNYYMLSKRLNISGMLISQSFVLGNIFLFISGVVVALPFYFIHYDYIGIEIRSIVAILILMMLIAIHPSVLQTIIKKVPIMKWYLQSSYFRSNTNRFYFFILFMFFLLWILAGFKLYFCAVSIHKIDISQIYIVLSAASSSLLIGLLAIFAPAGIGVNESVASLIMSNIMPVHTVILVVIISRMMQIITELLFGIIAYYSLLSKRFAK